ncbi:meiosis protein mei2 [Diplodia corticola]|uniref:Meiosis protein mei2 n=1 Tax=Diplodia corticola TaxID=236234 RepID=A0A1J9RFX8_9PEZI|nr:meiosis protein mei2 [Diplodia corticola]OJD38986.1 meiosis protein mei2 [Diplodia corticola]
MPSSSFLGSSSSPPFSVPGQNVAGNVNLSLGVTGPGPTSVVGLPPHQLALDPEAATLDAILRSLSDPKNVYFTSKEGHPLSRYVKFEPLAGTQSDPLKFKASFLLLLYSLTSFHLTTSSIFDQAKNIGRVGPKTLVFEFDMLSQAQAAINANHELECEGHLQFLKVTDYAHLLGNRHPDMPCFNKYEGQVLVNITQAREKFGDRKPAFLAMLAWMDQVLGSEAQRAVVCLGATANAVGYGYQFRMELDSLAFTEYLLKQWSVCREVKGSVYFAQVERFQPTGYEPTVAIPVLQRGASILPRGGHSGPVQIYQLGGPVQPFRERAYSAARRTSFGSGRRDDQNNAIDVEKIRRGLDVRTTVMLRNIPNQMTTYDLEALLDSWVHGKFDFLYLRIDFANMCNVGYAFVNFDMPMTIVDVKSKLDAQGWPGHLGSSKRAAMSYATVQGVESLIEKFRNSSVMCESPNCRPRLFYTFQDFPDPLLLPLVGAEKEFPGPNNEAKLARSRQNAETQGLYPAHSREEYRRDSFHSQFDRGNPNGIYGMARVSYY